jgi:hypothetical protein
MLLSRSKKIILFFAVPALAGVFLLLPADGPAAEAHNARGIEARFVGNPTWQDAIQTVSGKIKVINRRRPRLGSDGVGCRVSVFTRGGRNITGGRAIGYWDAIGRVPRGSSRILRFTTHWEYGAEAYRIRLSHCHTPWELNP